MNVRFPAHISPAEFISVIMQTRRREEIIATFKHGKTMCSILQRIICFRILSVVSCSSNISTRPRHQLIHLSSSSRPSPSRPPILWIAEILSKFQHAFLDLSRPLHVKLNVKRHLLLVPQYTATVFVLSSPLRYFTTRLAFRLVPPACFTVQSAIRKVVYKN